MSQLCLAASLAYRTIHTGEGPRAHSWANPSVAQSCLTLCDPMDCSMPGFPVLYPLLELAQTDVQRMRWLDGITNFDGHEFDQAPGVGDGQGSLAYCSPRVGKESDMTELLTELN